MISSLEEIAQKIGDGRFEESRELVVKVIKNSVWCAQAWVYLGEILENMHEFAAARFAYETAWILDPQASWWEITDIRLHNYRNGRIPQWVYNLRQVSRSTVSAVVIARNERNTITECVSRLIPAVDEVIVIDTGSVDETPTLAKDAGAIVYHFDWDDDFSAARNYGLGKVTSDWALFIDADELLLSEDVSIPRLVAGIYANVDPVAALRIVQINHVGSELRNNYDMVRMIPTGHKLRWWNRIHEQVGGPEGIMVNTFPIQKPVVRIRVDHCGYDIDVMRDKQKLQRNVRLLKKSVEDEPEDIGSWGFLGRESLLLGQNEEAILCFQRVEELLRKFPLYARMDEVYLNWIQALINLDRTSEAIRVGERAIERVQVSPEIYYNLGHLKVKMALNMMNESKGLFEKSLESAATYRGLVSFDQQIARWMAAASIADTYRFLGNWTEAWKWYNRAGYNCPTDAVARQQEQMKRQASSILES